MRISTGTKNRTRDSLVQSERRYAKLTCFTLIGKTLWIHTFVHGGGGGVSVSLLRVRAVVMLILILFFYLFIFVLFCFFSHEYFVVIYQVCYGGVPQENPVETRLAKVSNLFCFVLFFSHEYFVVTCQVCYGGVPQEYPVETRLAKVSNLFFDKISWSSE